MTNDEVAELLGVDLEEVEGLADDLGIPDDQWTPEDVFEADRMLDGEAEDDDE
jgi:hypothetical protein